MISIDEALRIILECTPQIEDSEEVPLLDALDRVLALDVHSDMDIPPLDNSAMDGYAVVARSVRGASAESPAPLPIVGEVLAGGLPEGGIAPGEAARVMTGAPIPEGADSVVAVEQTVCEGEEVRVLAAVEQGQNIRPAGEDLECGALAIPRGAHIRPTELGILAMVGTGTATVVRRPKVAIIATGDELVAADESPPPGCIRNSNSYSLWGQVARCGGEPVDLGAAPDREGDIRRLLEAGSECDVIVTSGGICVGERDLVREVLLQMGADVRFWKVAMKPGKPLAFGTFSGVPVFGLPGNPISSIVSFEQFVRPALFKMLGRIGPVRIEVCAILQEEIRKKPGRVRFVRASTVSDGFTFLTTPVAPHGSGVLSSMGRANSLIVVPEEREFLEKGEPVRVQLFD